jgi:thiol-disulfide isomerase/thioredoxin
MPILKKFFCALLCAIAILSSAKAEPKIIDGVSDFYPAPEISGTQQWFNSRPQKIAHLKGKVVLIDFWTYSCINCLRTLPHINELQQKYGDKGLVIIGVHAPEFDFEKNAQNVEKAIKRFGVKYAVVQDNNLQTWRNFQNRYWPAHYLINQEGKVVFEHFGEGKYDVLEKNIAALLSLKKPTNQKNSAAFFDKKITSETYLGSSRSKNNFNQSLKNLTFPKSLPVNGWALQGDWKIADQFVEAQKSDAALRLNFVSKKVFLVMASANKKTIKAKILFNGAPINLGADVKNGEVLVKESQLYEILNLPKIGEGLLEITASDAGLQAYAFTFGE